MTARCPRCSSRNWVSPSPISISASAPAAMGNRPVGSWSNSKRSWWRIALDRKRYALVTLHRPSNVDSREGLRSILGALTRIQREVPIVFPIHPRTRKMIEQYGLGEIVESMPDLYLIDPQGYLDFLRL